MLAINRLVKKFRSLVAVDDVTLSVAPGEIMVLIGPNGSGKTTIMKMIAGLLRPTAGGVTVGGFSTTADPEKTKSLIGYIPDEPAAWSAMTGEEFLHFVGTLYAMPEQERMLRIAGLLPIFHLEGIEKGYFEDYSRGNKQKFSILAALLHQPKLLLVDEPIVGLDPTSAEIARDQFGAYAKSGGALLLATHTLSVASTLATKIIVLQKGRITASGTLDDLRAQVSLTSHASLDDIYRALMR